MAAVQEKAQCVVRLAGAVLMSGATVGHLGAVSVPTSACEQTKPSVNDTGLGCF